MRLAGIYAVLVFSFALYFVLSRRFAPGPALLMPLAALPLGAIFGLLAAWAGSLRPRATVLLKTVFPGFSATFLLFFAHLLTFALAFSGLVTYPLSLLINDSGTIGYPPIVEFRLVSFNLALLLALAAWFLPPAIAVAEKRGWLRLT